MKTTIAMPKETLHGTIAGAWEVTERGGSVELRFHNGETGIVVSVGLEHENLAFLRTAFHEIANAHNRLMNLGTRR